MKNDENNDIIEFGEGGLIGLKSKSTLKDRNFEVDSFEMLPPKDGEVIVFVNVKYQYGKDKNYNQGWHKLEFSSDGIEAILKNVVIGKVKNGGGNVFADEAESSSESIHSLDYNYDYPSEFSKKLIQLVDEEAKNKIESYVPSDNEELVGGISDGMTLEDIAKMHNISYTSLRKQAEIGYGIEAEHTSDRKKIEEITKDHLFENPYYYTMLSEMENKYEKIKSGAHEPFKLADYSKGESVKMFDDEPSLIVMEINEWADKSPTYDLKSEDGSIVRNNIPEDKIHKMEDIQQGAELPELPVHVAETVVSDEDTLSIAIQDVIENHPTKKYSNLDLGEAKILYSLDEKDLNEDDSWSLGDPETLKHSVYNSLYDKGYIELSDEEVDLNSAHDVQSEILSLAYNLSNEGKQFINAVNARIETLKSVSEGTDMFPAEAAIPENVPEKNYSDIKSCLISEGDNESIYLFEGKEISDTSTAIIERWKIVSFFKYGVNLEHVEKNKLATKKESKQLTFTDILSLYDNGEITIDGVDSHTTLNHCLKLLVKCIDLIDARDGIEQEKSLHAGTKSEQELIKAAHELEKADLEAKFKEREGVLKKTKEKLKKHQSEKISKINYKTSQKNIANSLIELHDSVMKSFRFNKDSDLLVTKDRQIAYKNAMDSGIAAMSLEFPLSEIVNKTLSTNNPILNLYLSLSGLYGGQDKADAVKFLSNLSSGRAKFLYGGLYSDLLFEEEGTPKQIEWKLEIKRLKNIKESRTNQAEIDTLDEAIEILTMLLDDSIVNEENYIAVHESKDGYWSIASKPTTKAIALEHISGAPSGQVGKVVKLDEARAHKKVVGEEYLYEKGGEVGGRGWGEFHKGRRITDIKDLKIGKMYLSHNNKFNSDNIFIINRGDETGLDRDIVYASFVRPNSLKHKEGDFALWGDDLQDNELYEIKGDIYADGGVILKEISTHKAVKDVDVINIYEKGLPISIAEGDELERHPEWFKDRLVRSIPLDNEDDLFAMFEMYEEDNPINLAEGNDEFSSMGDGGSVGLTPEDMKSGISVKHVSLPQVFTVIEKKDDGTWELESDGFNTSIGEKNLRHWRFVPEERKRNEIEYAKGGGVGERTYSQWEDEVISEVESELDVTRSDAQGVVEAQSFKMAQSWGKGLSGKETAKIIILESEKMKDGGAIGFIPMDLEEIIVNTAKWGDTDMKGVIGILSAMIDSGLTDDDLKTPPTKTGNQYTNAKDKKTKEIWAIIEPNYKGELKGYHPLPTIRHLVHRATSDGDKTLQRFKPFRKYQKDSMADGGEVKVKMESENEIREKVNDFLNPLGYSAKVENIGNGDILIEPSTRKVGSNRSDFFDGMQITRFRDGAYEVAEYKAGKNEDEIHIYKETRSLTVALKDLIKGNKRKSIKKFEEGGGVYTKKEYNREDYTKLLDKYDNLTEDYMNLEDEPDEALANTKRAELKKQIDETELEISKYERADLKMADGGSIGSVKDYYTNSNNRNIPKDIMFKGKEYKGEASFINGYNGYESTEEDGILAALINNSLWTKGKPNFLTDKDGFKIRAKDLRGQLLKIMYADGGEVYKYSNNVVELSALEIERLDILQKREDLDILTASENKEYEELVEKYRKTKLGEGAKISKEEYKKMRDEYDDFEWKFNDLEEIKDPKEKAEKRAALQKEAYELEGKINAYEHSLVSKPNARIDEMYNNWNKEGRAFSNINNDDTSFFGKIWLSPESVGTTSQTGNDLLYYNTDIYESGSDAIKGIKKLADGGSVSYDDLAKKAIKKGDTVIVNAGRHINAEAKVIAMGTFGNDYTVQFPDGVKAIVFRMDIEKVNESPKESNFVTEYSEIKESVRPEIEQAVSEGYDEVITTALGIGKETGVALVKGNEVFKSYPLSYKSPITDIIKEIKSKFEEGGEIGALEGWEKTQLERLKMDLENYKSTGRSEKDINMKETQIKHLTNYISARVNTDKEIIESQFGKTE